MHHETYPYDQCKVKELLKYWRKVFIFVLEVHYFQSLDNTIAFIYNFL